MSKTLNTEITYWEKVASSKWGKYITAIQKETILKAHYLSAEPTTALEIGCDGGRWSKLLSDLGWDMICTDIKPKRLDICKKRVPTAKCILVSPNDTKLPFDPETIDLLLCLEVTPVIQSEWFILETMRVLNNGGLVVGVFWNLLSFRGLFSHLSAPFRGGSETYKFTYLQWRRKFCQGGFDLLYEKGLCWFPFPRTSNSSLVPVFTRIEQLLGLRSLVTLSPWIIFIAQKNNRKE